MSERLVGSGWCDVDLCPVSICGGPHEEREIEGLGTVTARVGEPWPPLTDAVDA